MTAIAIWSNNENKNNPTLWCVSDSLVSRDKSALIKDAVKIFTLPLICRSPGKDGFFSEPYLVRTLGYCFAGSTLMGQNTFLGLAPLLSNVISPSAYRPSLKDVAEMAFSYLKQTFDDYKLTGFESSIFQVAIFGFCSSSERLQVFHFRPKMIEGTWSMTMEAHEEMREGDFVYLGSQEEAITDEIKKALGAEEMPGRPISRIPRYVIQDRIESDESPTIGGDVQLVIADKFGTRPYALCKPYAEGEPAAYFSYLGRELTPDLTRVGEAMVSLDAMI